MNRVNMLLLQNAEEMFGRIAQIRIDSKCFLTNLYAMPPEIESWCDRSQVKVVQGNGGLLLIRAGQNLSYVYHAAIDEAGLANALANLDGEVQSPLIAELVGRGDDARGAVDTYRAFRFSEYTTLLRMTKTLQAAPPPEDPTSEWRSGAQDAIPIAEFLERVLDPFRDHMPALGEIQKAIESGGILAHKVRQEIRGVLFHENAASTSTLRYWYVDPRHRNDGIGRHLMREYLRLCKGKRRIVLWVVSDNHNAIQKYQHYGFEFDGLVDQIMVRSGRA